MNLHLETRKIESEWLQGEYGLYSTNPSLYPDSALTVDEYYEILFIHRYVRQAKATKTNKRTKKKQTEKQSKCERAV